MAPTKQLILVFLLSTIAVLLATWTVYDEAFYSESDPELLSFLQDSIGGQEDPAATCAHICRKLFF